MRTEEEMKHSNEKQFGFQLANQLLEFVEFWFKVLERKNLQEESSFFFLQENNFLSSYDEINQSYTTKV